MSTEHEFLASAYVDGDLTDDERRIAEADPAVMAEVVEIRVLREQLADVPPPTAEARESAIAAAMGVFREQHAAAPVAATASAPPRAHRAPAPSNVVSFWRRPAAMRLLGAAAAVLVIGVLGVVIATGLRSSDDDDSLSFDAAAEEPADEPADEPASEEIATADDEARITESVEAGATVPAADADAGFADGAEQAEMASDEALSAPADDAAADEPADEPAEEPADEPVAEPAVEPVFFFGFEQDGEPVPIFSSEELTEAGAYLLELEQREPELLTPTPNTSCGPALATATVIVGDEAIPVTIVVDGDISQVVAYDADCTVVLDAPYPG